MRVALAGIWIWRAIHLGVISAATVIGRTSMLKSKSAWADKSLTIRRRAGSASRPVTKWRFSRLLITIRPVAGTDQSTVDGNDLSGHEGGRGRGQEAGCVCHILRCSPPLQQRFLLSSLVNDSRPLSSLQIGRQPTNSIAITRDVHRRHYCKCLLLGEFNSIPHHISIDAL